jgi:hypothetical protein
MVTMALESDSFIVKSRREKKKRRRNKDVTDEQFRRRVMLVEEREVTVTDRVEMNEREDNIFDRFDRVSIEKKNFDRLFDQTKVEVDDMSARIDHHEMNSNRNRLIQ